MTEQPDIPTSFNDYGKAAMNAEPDTTTPDHPYSSNGKGACRVCGADQPPSWPVSIRHNHLTRDIKPEGQCPRCDLHWKASR